MKKYKKLIVVLFIIIIIILLIFIVLKTIENNTIELFKSERKYSCTFIPQDYGYIIYSDGKIQEYNNIYDDVELKSAKLEKNELKRLKKLVNEVTDEYEYKEIPTNSIASILGGTNRQQIYSKKLEKWVVLYESGDTNGENNTEVAQEILTLTQELYDKYLK